MPSGNYRKNVSTLILLACVILCAASALANEESPVGKDKFKLSIGGFFSTIDSQLKINSKSIGMGTNIDLESDLGFDEDVSLGRIEGYWRFAKKHRLYLGYYGFDRDAVHTLDKETVIDDKVFVVGADLYSNWEVDFFMPLMGIHFFRVRNGNFPEHLGFIILILSLLPQVQPISIVLLEE